MTAEVLPPTTEIPNARKKNKFELLNVIVEKVTGTVKWFSIRRHYGFIQRDDNQEDVFVHRTAITASRSRFPTLKNGEPVEFSVVETTGGVNAASVTGPDGNDVIGVRMFRRPKGPTTGEGSEMAYAPVNGDPAQAGGDFEGSRPRTGLRRPRRPRRSAQPSQNGMGDGEGVEGPIEGAEDVGGALPRQRPRRFRGGRFRQGGNRQRSISNKQQPDGEGHESVAAEDGALVDETGAPEGSRTGGPRRGGGRIRRGGGGRNRRSGPVKDAGTSDNAADPFTGNGGYNEHPLEKKMESMSLEGKHAEEQHNSAQEKSVDGPPKLEPVVGDAN